jgi:hypothetical protein
VSTRVRSLACLFFVAHFVASVYVVLNVFGASVAFFETGPTPGPSRLLEVAEQVLTFPILPIVPSLPSAVSRFVPWWTPFMVNSLLWVGIVLLLTSKCVRRPRAA